VAYFWFQVGCVVFCFRLNIFRLPAKNLFDFEIWLPVQYEANLAFFPSLRSQFVISEAVRVQLAHNQAAVAPVRFAHIALALVRRAIVHMFLVLMHTELECIVLYCRADNGCRPKVPVVKRGQ
jgi:hypothetical protein